MHGSRSVKRSDQRCAVSLRHSGSPIHGKSQRCRLSYVISCVQSQLITWNMYTDHQNTDDQCALMISVAPAVPPVSVRQCSSVPHASATSMPHISVYECTTMPHISAHLSCLSVSPVSATYQCQSVPPISAAYQCPVSAA
ncbi:unnamed protein product [Staurois parvus]|uniref:Uncharacterized protein n=1 Tax=Staurois parvus TaxID=386267 RepID=A0ABN9GME7_9NEOB|nr:unnamed protein product [Staurois parvus]